MVRVAPSVLRDVAVAILVASGADVTDARAVSDVLVWADHRGRHAQGTIWLDTLTTRLQLGDTLSPAPMVIEDRFPAFAAIDGGGGFGHVAGRLAIEFVAERATHQGVAVATVRNSSHFGPCGYWAADLANRGLIGIVATNAYPKVAPFGSAVASIGTNPIGFSASVEGGRPLIADFSTGALAGSRVREAVSNHEELPPGSILDRSGRPSTDPADLLDGGVMLPFGGPKGSSLALLVELLTSVLAEGAPPDEMGSMFGRGPAGTSHFFLAIASPDSTPRRLAHVRALILDAPSIDGVAVRLPGDAGHEHQLDDVVDLPVDSLDAIRTAAARGKVDVEGLGR